MVYYKDFENFLEKHKEDFCNVLANTESFEKNVRELTQENFSNAKKLKLERIDYIEENLSISTKYFYTLAEFDSNDYREILNLNKSIATTKFQVDVDNSVNFDDFKYLPSPLHVKNISVEENKSTAFTYFFYI